MTRFLDWVDFVLIGWLVVSAVATPLVGRFLSRTLSVDKVPPAPLKTPPEAGPVPPRTRA